MSATRISVIVLSAVGSAIIATGTASRPVAGAGGHALTHASRGAPEWYSTYLGGAGQTLAYSTAVDRGGNLYIAGGTTSRHFPTVHAFQPRYRGFGSDERIQADAFIAKLSPTGKLLYSTYLGGTAGDEATGVAVDRTGNAYVTGLTDSPDFPTLRPLQRHCQVLRGPAIEPCDASFVAKLSPTGHLLWSTFFGGYRPPDEMEGDSADSIAVDATGGVVIAGGDDGNRLPVVHALQPHPVPSGTGNAFVAKINAAGTRLVYSTYLGDSVVTRGFGGGNVDTGNGVLALAEDSRGNAYVAGKSSSKDFPAGFGKRYAASADHLFVAKLNSDGRLVYLFARAVDPPVDGVDTEVGGIAVDRQGRAYITGTTNSDQFPVLHAVQGSLGGGDCYLNGTITRPCNDAFIVKLDARGDHLLYSTFLGGSEDDTGNAIAVDARGDTIVSGAGGEHFPTMNPLQVGYGGGEDQPGGGGMTDAFVAKISPAGSTLLFSTLLGGAGADEGDAVALAPSGIVYVAGSTDSSDFPVHRALQPDLVGKEAAFVMRLPDTLRPLIHKHAVSTWAGPLTVGIIAIVIIVAVWFLIFRVRKAGRKLQAV